MTEIAVEMRPVAAVFPYYNNPRDNSMAVAGVAASLREFGWVQPIVVDKEGVVIVGHTRLAAALSLGMESVPVKIADLSEGLARAYRIADNRVGENAEWDKKLLALEAVDLGPGYSVPGFTDEEFARLLKAAERAENALSITAKDLISAPAFSILDGRSEDWATRAGEWLGDALARGVVSESPSIDFMLAETVVRGFSSPGDDVVVVEDVGAFGLALDFVAKTLDRTPQRGGVKAPLVLARVPGRDLAPAAGIVAPGGFLAVFSPGGCPLPPVPGLTLYNDFVFLRPHVHAAFDPYSVPVAHEYVSLFYAGSEAEMRANVDRMNAIAEEFTVEDGDGNPPE